MEQLLLSSDLLLLLLWERLLRQQTIKHRFRIDLFFYFSLFFSFHMSYLETDMGSVEMIRGAEISMGELVLAKPYLKYL